ncbi:hypothetical protein vseg_017028 [Gypsophila vaccaria]
MSTLTFTTTATTTTTAAFTFLRPTLSPTTLLRRTNHRSIHLPPPFSLKPLSLSSSTTKTPNFPNPNPNPKPQINFTPNFLNSTKTLTLLLTITTTIAVKLIKLVSPSPETLQFLNDNVFPTVGPLVFAAAAKSRPSGYLNTPLTVVASGMAKWLDIYSGVLMVRVLLSWFPNIPWDRQPLSAIRDLCDPYLNLFRNIIPPIFDTLDVSPLLAFAVLGTLGSILSSAKGGY